LGERVTFTVLYVDNHLLAVCKPAGMLTQGDRTGDTSLLELCRTYVKQQFNKPGNVFLGLAHRLDRPVSGVVVFARTSKAAARLSAQFRTRQVQKIYWALVEGKVPAEGILVDRLVRTVTRSRIATNEPGLLAELRFTRRGYCRGTSWVEIALGTGRHHQIRVQFAHYGHPVVGDHRYGAATSFTSHAIALHARALRLKHPTRPEVLTFTAETERHWPQHFRSRSLAAEQEVSSPCDRTSASS
jgi:23S rRNA pseudouridine1911/1915/1917 synthase